MSDEYVLLVGGPYDGCDMPRPTGDNSELSILKMQVELSDDGLPIHKFVRYAIAEDGEAAFYIGEEALEATLGRDWVKAARAEESE
ncbi:MAG: hypothetical protein ACRDQZ_20605 [Mycobacteriales bacterium]